MVPACEVSGIQPNLFKFGINLSVEVGAASFRINLFCRIAKPFVESTIPGSHSSIVVVIASLVVPIFILSMFFDSSIKATLFSYIPFLDACGTPLLRDGSSTGFRRLSS